MLCTNFIERINAFCAYFFHREAQEWGIVPRKLPSAVGLEGRLKKVADLYTGAKRKDKRSIEFYQKTQNEWNVKMISIRESLVAHLIRNLRKAIGRGRSINSLVNTQKYKDVSPFSFLSSTHLRSVAQISHGIMLFSVYSLKSG